jgi:hypothetical protein
MHNDLYDGAAAGIVEGTNILLGRGWSAGPDDALVAGIGSSGSTSAAGSCSSPRSSSPPTP